MPHFSDATWRSVKRMLDAGWKATEIAKKIPNMKAQDIYNKKRQWQREDYYTNPKNAIYFSDKYKAWRLAVFKRDKFTCRWCKRSGRYVRLEADHILPKSTHPQLMYKISNGRTLCRRCHRKTPTFGLKALNYK